MLIDPKRAAAILDDEQALNRLAASTAVPVEQVRAILECLVSRAEQAGIA